MVHHPLYDRARRELEDHVTVTEEWEEFCSSLDRKMLIMAPFCGEISCEDLIKKDTSKPEDVKTESTGAKSLCVPFDQPRPLASGQSCIHPECNNTAQYYALFGRSY